MLLCVVTHRLNNFKEKNSDVLYTRIFCTLFFYYACSALTICPIVVSVLLFFAYFILYINSPSVICQTTTFINNISSRDRISRFDSSTGAATLRRFSIQSVLLGNDEILHISKNNRFIISNQLNTMEPF